MSSEKEENDMGIYKRRDNIKSCDLKKGHGFFCSGKRVLRMLNKCTNPVKQ